MEPEAERLEVVEQPRAQVEQQRLSDASRALEEQPEGDRLHERDEREDRDDQDERAGVAAAAAQQRRDAPVDAELDQVRPCHRRRVLHDDEHAQPPQGPPVRPQQ